MVQDSSVAAVHIHGVLFDFIVMLHFGLYFFPDFFLRSLLYLPFRSLLVHRTLTAFWHVVVVASWLQRSCFLHVRSIIHFISLLYLSFLISVACFLIDWAVSIISFSFRSYW